MTVNSSRVRGLLDVDASVTLRNASDGAETSTATETAISLNELDNAFWDDGNQIPYGTFTVSIHVSALDRTTGDETYTLALLVDDTSNLSDSPVTIGSISITQVGYYTIVIDSKNIPLLDADTSGTDKWMAIRATLGGTTPSITYGAWLSKAECC